MFRFLRRLLVFLFLISISLLTLFYVPPAWYSHWTIAFIVWAIISFLIAWRSVHSRKVENLIMKTAGEWKVIQDLEEQVRTDSRLMEMTCPACEIKTSYWSFLDNFKCRSCGSDLFGAKVREMGEPWLDLLKRRERIQTFYDRTPPWLLRKGKNRAL